MKQAHNYDPSQELEINDDESTLPAPALSSTAQIEPAPFSYNGIVVFDAKDRDMLIMSNISDAQEMIRYGKEPEALQVLNDLKKFMIASRVFVN